MYKINDEMLALIVRFIGLSQNITIEEQGYIRDELKAIEQYVGRFPPEEHEARAMEWVKRFARAYRKRWEEEEIDRELSKTKCPDCPLVKDDDSGHCQIHDQWRELLKQYMVKDINSEEYINNALQLLSQHKEDLKIKMSHM